MAVAESVRLLESLHRVGTGSPENVVTAPRGAHFHRTDGGANTSLYVKEGGPAGSDQSAWTKTNWAAK